MGQDRTERISSIFSRRKPLVSDIRNIRASISKVTAGFDKMLPVCQAVLDDESLASEFAGMSGVLDTCARPLSELRRLNGELSLLQNRFSRDTLNIAVIGRARQGKSRLLQTITGLGSEEIPDGNQAFCTGVRSDIINTPNLTSAYAQVSFLTERQFIDEKVAPYFRDLQQYKADLFTPADVHDFESLRLPESGTFKASPETMTQMNLHLQHLRDLQAHLPQYQEYLGRSPMRIGRGQIREYVAQDNAEGERVYFKHMAVDCVKIFCAFPNSDVGKLRLIDLPGLGDTRKGDTEQLVRALGDKLPIERWSFWVFNRDSREGADNMTQCGLLRDSIRDAQIQVAGTMIADCTDYDDVSREVVDKVLDSLAANIERNDAEYVGYIQDDIARTVSQLRENLSRLEEMTREGRASDDDADMFDVLFSAIWKKLAVGIQSCVGKGSELRDAKGTPCESLRERIEAIFTEAESGESFPFDEEGIREKYLEYGDTIRVYPECLHILRTQLGTRMQEDMDGILDAVMTAMKDKFGHVLGTSGRLAGKFGCDNHEILGRIASYIREKNLANSVPTLLYGLELLDGWKLNYRSFAQHRIREALNCLDPLDDAKHHRESRATSQKSSTCCRISTSRQSTRCARGSTGRAGFTLSLTMPRLPPPKSSRTS